MPSKRRLEIALPASLVSDVPHLREKTSIVGRIGRAAAIFGVSKILVFQDVNEGTQYRERELIKTILSYMETPQYLRKRLFRINPVLRYAGVLPPLRTAHHPISRRVKVGEYRDGYTLSHTKNGTIVDVGVGRHFIVKNRKLTINKRFTFRIAETRGEPQAEVANPRKISKYWGYKVINSELTLGRVLRKSNFDLVIATSRHGRPLRQILGQLRSHWNASRTILIVFGAPTQGLYEILERESMDLEDSVDFVVNTIPWQKVETVRTEEAVMATLSSINSLFC